MICPCYVVHLVIAIDFVQTAIWPGAVQLKQKGDFEAKTYFLGSPCESIISVDVAELYVHVFIFVTQKMGVGDITWDGFCRSDRRLFCLAVYKVYTLYTPP